MSATKDEDEKGAPAIELAGVTKQFGSISAVDDVSFAIAKGEVVALLGDNGAGKSTVVKMISGVVTPNRGTIRLDGTDITSWSAKARREAGIATVYQDLGLVPTMNVWRNFFLGAELKSSSGLDVKTMRQATAVALEEIGLRNLRSVDQNVMKLSGGEQQALSIGRAVHFERKLLVLDEPTAALSVKETERVFDYIRLAKSKGLGVLLIMHNTAHALQVSDSVVVMFHGRVAARYAVEDRGMEMLETVNSAISGID